MLTDKKELKIRFELPYHYFIFILTLSKITKTNI